MDTTKWKEVERLFFELVELPHEAQNSGLERIRDNRPDIYQEVYELIKEEQKLHPMLKTDFPQSWQEWQDIDLLGKEVGAYKLSKLLGSGGMGSVFLAERIDGIFEQIVALKLINEGIYGEQSLEFFRRERQILAKLRHPNIASLLDGGVISNGRPYYTMEYIDGLPIDQYCRKNRCTLEERLKLFIQICDAVQYAHSQLVLHLDLKPSNIFVDQEGRVKLMDFGISQLIQAPVSIEEVITAPVKRYTLAYASPEQISGGDLSTASDVHALGVMLYEMLTELHPFEGSTSDHMTLRSDILHKSPVFPSEALNSHKTTMGIQARTLQTDLDLICMKALSKLPHERYTSVNDLKEDIEAFLNQQPVSLLKHKWSYVAAKFIRRNRATVSLIVLGLLMIFGLATFYTWKLGKERDKAVREANKANEMVNLLSGMFTQANPNVSLGEDITAGEMLELGAVRFQKDLKEDPELLAEMYDVLGAVYLDLANYSRADSLFRLSLELKYNTSEKLTPDQLMSYYYLGRVNGSEGKFDSAVYYYETVLKNREQFPASEVVSLSDIYYELGVIEGENANYRVSDSLLKLTLKYRTNAQPDSFDALIYLSRGINARKLQQFDSAKYYYRKALEIRRDLYPEVHPEVAHSLNHFASLYQDMEQYDQALPYAQKSLGIRKQIFGEEHPETLASWSNVARTYSRSGDYDRALATYDTVLIYFKKVFGEEHYYISGLTGSIGRVYMRKKYYTDAEIYFRKSLDIALRTLPEDHYNQAFSYFGLGQALAAREKWTEAEKHFLDALRIRELTLEPENPLVVEAKTSLGECLKALNKYEEAKSYLSQALEILSRKPEANRDKIIHITQLMQAP